MMDIITPPNCCCQSGLPVQPVLIRCACLNSPDTVTSTWNQTPTKNILLLILLTVCQLNTRVEVKNVTTSNSFQAALHYSIAVPALPHPFVAFILCFSQLVDTLTTHKCSLRSFATHLGNSISI